MTTIVQSIGLKGMEGYPVQVEVQLIPGVESVSIVGLPDTSVKESKERVMAALYAYDISLPDQKVIVHLSPAEERKNSPVFDLAMALAIMKEAGEIYDRLPRDTAYLGVLSLDGTIRSVDGMLPAVLAAKRIGIKVLYLPVIPAVDLEEIEGIELRFVSALQEVIDSFSAQFVFPTSTPQKQLKVDDQHTPYNQKDFKHILGHDRAKRALEIAAAGGHNLLLSGPPGCGKSLLAETFPSILPPLSLDNQYEVLSLYQLAGQTYQRRPHPPFRTPHHSASAISLIGGGTNPKPGEVSLAHHGVLFLDEMAEFSKKTLDMLRQPIESGQVTISRVSSTVTYPALFILIGTMNPCPCGYAGSRHYYCTCSPNQITTYKNRLSGPIQDRIDILLDLEAVVLEQEQIEKNENSAAIQKRVIAARMRQHNRYGKNGLNAIVSPELLLENSRLTEEQQRMMQQRASKNNWSTRVQMKIIRLAQTISDLAGEETISSEALWEAMTLRRSQVQQQRQRKAK